MFTVWPAIMVHHIGFLVWSFNIHLAFVTLKENIIYRSNPSVMHDTIAFHNGKLMANWTLR